MSDTIPIRINENKIEDRITFRIKTRYYLQLLTIETLKLLGSTKIKITKHKNGENVPHLEITEVISVHCNVVKILSNKIQGSYMHLFLINHLVNY